MAWTDSDLATYGVANAIPDELAYAAGRYWFGTDPGYTVTPNHMTTPKWSSDGGGYRFVGTQIRSIGSGESAVIYWEEHPGRYVIEFYDTSGGNIRDNGDGTYTFRSYYNDPVTF